MNLTLRALNPETDFAALAGLLSLIEPEPVTEAILQERERKRPADEQRHRVIAVNEAATIIGYGSARTEKWSKQETFDLYLIVEPAWRNQGIGTRLYEEVEAFAGAHGAQSLQANVRDDCASCLQFARQRGFVQKRHLFESVLDVPAFDDSRFAGVVDSVRATGLRLFSFAEAGDTPDNRRRLYELNIITGRDIPGHDLNSKWPFEQFEKDVSESYWFRPDGQLFAADGDRWVGMAAVGEIAPRRMYNMTTGVLRDYRGGILLSP